MSRAIDARLRIGSRLGSASPYARSFLTNEVNLGRIGGRLPDGVGESSLVQLRALLAFVVASLHAQADVPVIFGRKRARADPRVHRRYQTLEDGKIQVL